MKERPILFSAPMVRVILEGRKTQTRRVVTRRTDGRVQVPLDYRDGMFWFDDGDVLSLDSAYGVPGDRLWVRETWWMIPEPSLQDLREGADTWPKPTGPQEQRVAYAADGDDADQVREWGWKLRPSIFMPRWASRIALEVTEVRVQSIQRISEEDAEAEGVLAHIAIHSLNKVFRDDRGATSIKYFRNLWDSINAKRGFGWDVNPWVWAITFKRVTG